MKKVLIMEDEVNIRAFVVINLKRAGYEAIEAATGLEALFGWLYLSGKQDRLLEIWGKILTLGEEA